MDGFKLDTSGAVNVPPRTDQGRTATWRCEWDQLSSFEQGYTKRALEDLAERLITTQRTAPGDFTGRFERWSYTIEGQGAGGGFATEASAREAARKAVKLRFDMLAPETLAAIRKDCAAIQQTGFYGQTSEDGANFWRERSRNDNPSFPPLTPTLADDGKVYLREQA